MPACGMSGCVSRAAAGGHLEALSWVVELGCPSDPGRLLPYSCLQINSTFHNNLRYGTSSA